MDEYEYRKNNWDNGPSQIRFNQVTEKVEDGRYHLRPMSQWNRRHREMRSHRYGPNPLPSAPPQTPNPPNFQHQPSSTVGQQQPSSRSYQYANNPGIQAQHITNIFRCCTLL